MVRTDPAVVDRYQRRLHSRDYQQWREQVEATGGCTHPVRMTGAWTVTDNTTSQVLAHKGGHVMVPCGNRRESVCAACSDRYAADAFHLLRAGLSGGTKGVPEHVTERPRVFLTLTAPSFGPVRDDGQPRFPTRYDYTGHVLFNAHAGQLWHRFVIALRRHLAKAAGIRVRDFADHARLSYAKVAEYQRRGAIHFHAVIRLDRPGGASDQAPAWATPDLLADAIHAAHAQVKITTPEIDGQALELAWGRQIDVRTIKAANAPHFEDGNGEITDDRLSSYVAKYATKGTGKSEAADRPIRSDAHIEQLRINEHYKQLMRTAWALGGLEELDHLNLRRWCHMLAFRGHFLSKSKAFSTTFKQIRGDRQRYRLEAALDELGVTEDAVTVVNHWDLTSVGHRTPEERDIAEGIAQRRRDTRKHHHTTERKD
ncbi:replication initiation protein [Saccharopolyspora sp. NFXS83]|uniref:replication initiator n=1 Tax=Saccharopolyspora sp. NFXS83 TaxID=2993560 RepID=UPI00224A661A|nr:replication initiator [Saccharopolyspora sp. NFXS83]MCX2732010.1 replication initiation protein [Saccharopolyspora sp. NFXS83]